MSHDLELVTVSAPDDEALRSALTTAWFVAGLPEPELVGVLAEDPLLEVVSDDEPVLHVFRPHRRTTAAGPRWVTPMRLDGAAPAEVGEAVVGAAAALARASQGHLLVDGAVAELDGVPAPDAAALAPPADPDGGDDAEDAPLVFASASLDTVTLGDDGWRDMLGALAAWVGDRTAWLPAWRRDVEEWEPFSPDDPTPDWWPDTMRLATHGGAVTWTIDDAAYPESVYAQLQAEVRGPADDAGALLGGVAALAPWSPVFAMVHPWHPDEPFLVEGPRRDGADEPPYLMLTDHGLTQGLPNLYWGTVIGGPWAAAIGAERLAATPAHRVSELLPGTWLLQLTARVSDVLDDYAAFAAVRDACKSHLGADLFRADDGLDCLAPAPVPVGDLADRGLLLR